MRILVTAGLGLTGFAFRKLAENNYSDHKFLFHTRNSGDLSDPIVFKTLLTDFNPDIVIHNASKLHGYFATSENIELCKKTNESIFNNLLDELLPHQFVYSLSSYHVFTGSAPFRILDLGLLNRDSSYALEKSQQIKNAQFFPNVKFVVLPHLFGEYDNFSPGRAHFIANSIRRIVSAHELQEPKIELLGSSNRILQFATAESVAKFTLDTILFNSDREVKYFLADIGWKRTCIDVFTSICTTIGYEGVVISVDSSTLTQERDMYFSTNSKSDDFDELELQTSLGLAVSYFKRGKIRNDI